MGPFDNQAEQEEASGSSIPAIVLPPLRTFVVKLANGYDRITRDQKFKEVFIMAHRWEFVVHGQGVGAIFFEYRQIPGNLRPLYGGRPVNDESHQLYASVLEVTEVPSAPTPSSVN